jgi:hypothetical protein
LQDNINIDINIDTYHQQVKKGEDLCVQYALSIIRHVRREYEEKDKAIIFIIDQIDSLKSIKFEFLNQLLTSNKCIISSPANNHEYDEPMLRRSKIHKIKPKTTFSTNEFKLFLRLVGDVA